MNWVLAQQIGMTILVVILLVVVAISLRKVIPEINQIVRDSEEQEKSRDGSRD